MADYTNGVAYGLPFYNHDAAISGAPGAKALGAVAYSDVYYGGAGSYANTVGQVLVPGGAELPVQRRVSLFDRKIQLLVRQTWSDPITGAYVFAGLRTDVAFRVEVDDYAGVFNSVSADWQYAT